MVLLLKVRFSFLPPMDVTVIPVAEEVVDKASLLLDIIPVTTPEVPLFIVMVQFVMVMFLQPSVPLAFLK